MSAGKSEVKRFSLFDSESMSFMDESPVGPYVLHSDYAALESLLLDARAERDRAIARTEPIEARFTELSSALEIEQLLRKRAEALAGERLALLIEARDELACTLENERSDKDTESKIIARIDTAIDAVGGRGE